MVWYCLFLVTLTKETLCFFALSCFTYKNTPKFTNNEPILLGKKVDTLSVLGLHDCVSFVVQLTKTGDATHFEHFETSLFENSSFFGRYFRTKNKPNSTNNVPNPLRKKLDTFSKWVLQACKILSNNYNYPSRYPPTSHLCNR